MGELGVKKHSLLSYQTSEGKFGDSGDSGLDLQGGREAGRLLLKAHAIGRTGAALPKHRKAASHKNRQKT